MISLSLELRTKMDALLRKTLERLKFYKKTIKSSKNISKLSFYIKIHVYGPPSYKNLFFTDIFKGQYSGINALYLPDTHC